MFNDIGVHEELLNMYWQSVSEGNYYIIFEFYFFFLLLGYFIIFSFLFDNSIIW